MIPCLLDENAAASDRRASHDNGKPLNFAANTDC
jgi:hypothetical protein